MEAADATRVRRYERKRYSSPDQRLVNHLESRVIERYLDALCWPCDSVLDMPCGYGRFAPVLLRRADMMVCGDRKAAMLNRTRERMGKATPAVRLVSDWLPFADNSFDAVICIRLMQHLHDDDQRRRTLAEIGRVARRGAIITVYLDSPVHRLVHGTRRLKRLTRDRMDRLEQQLAHCGLRIRRHSRILPGLHAQSILLLESVSSTA